MEESEAGGVRVGGDSSGRLCWKGEVERVKFGWEAGGMKHQGSDLPYDVVTYSDMDVIIDVTSAKMDKMGNVTRSLECFVWF